MNFLLIEISKRVGVRGDEKPDCKGIGSMNHRQSWAAGLTKPRIPWPRFGCSFGIEGMFECA